jgi:hypothetical protein
LMVEEEWEEGVREREGLWREWSKREGKGRGRTEETVFYFNVAFNKSTDS